MSQGSADEVRQKYLDKFEGQAPSKWNVSVQESDGVTKIAMTDADAAFIVGRNGRVVLHFEDQM
jgi:hypothetical protein